MKGKDFATALRAALPTRPTFEIVTGMPGRARSERDCETVRVFKRLP